MAAPANVPKTDSPPKIYQSPPRRPEPWTAVRPGEVVGTDTSNNPAKFDHSDTLKLGYQGPDQGYALKLAQRFASAVTVAPGEWVDDALAGCSAVALRRASLFGRAPVVQDLRLALELFGFMSESDATQIDTDLTDWRRDVFAGAAGHHGYEVRGRLVAMIPEATLRGTPLAVAEARDEDWRRAVGLTQSTV